VRKLSLSTLLSLSCILAFGQYTPATVPNTKLDNNSYVSNPNNIISKSTVAAIDTTLLHLEKQTTAQVEVVLLHSIGDVDIFDFSEELFNLWGIGNEKSNNGLLILFVEDPHGIRLHTGRGLEGVLPDAVCKRIERDQMIPSFKAGDIDTGILNGVNEVVKVLTDPDYAAELKAAEGGGYEFAGYQGFVLTCVIFLLPIFLIAWAYKRKRFSNSKGQYPTDYPQMRMTRSTWLILFGGIPVLIIMAYGFAQPEGADGLALITLYLYLMATVFYRLIRERRMFNKLREKRKYFEITEYLRKSTFYWFVMALIFPIPFLGYFPFHFARRKLYRNHPRKCTLCEGSMSKLDEKQDDAYLTRSQLIEENIKSVNYDVWQCDECHATEAWHFVNRWSKYEICSKCKARAWYLVSDRTLKSPTYSSSGTGERLHQCKACGRSDRKTYTMAQLTRSSSSSSSGGSSYGGSSSSGGSWGGGSSGGGGASSSW